METVGPRHVTEKPCWDAAVGEVRRLRTATGRSDSVWRGHVLGVAGTWGDVQSTGYETLRSPSSGWAGQVSPPPQEALEGCAQGIEHLTASGQLCPVNTPLVDSSRGRDADPQPLGSRGKQGRTSLSPGSPEPGGRAGVTTLSAGSREARRGTPVAPPWTLEKSSSMPVRAKLGAPGPRCFSMDWFVFAESAL